MQKKENILKREVLLVAQREVINLQLGGQEHICEGRRTMYKSPMRRKTTTIFFVVVPLHLVLNLAYSVQ